jgi:Sec-independent protein secretion pathway component TatC
VEASPYARCTKLLVARTVFSARRSIFCYRVFNPTDKTIGISTNTAIAMVSPVIVYEHVDPIAPSNEDSNFTIAETKKYWKKSRSRLKTLHSPETSG